MLSTNLVVEYIDTDLIGLEPFITDNIQPTSIDLTLGRYLKTYVQGPRDVIENVVDLDEIGGLHIEHGMFMLGATAERVRLPDFIAARFEGKSTLGRKGLLTHVSAGFIDPGFEGDITVEIVNHHPRPFLLTPGMKIGQICFFMIEGPPRGKYGDSMYGNHYQGQSGPTPPYDES